MIIEKSDSDPDPIKIIVSSFSLCKTIVNSTYTVSEKGHVHSIRNGL
jgi:hypothetical protein